MKRRKILFGTGSVLAGSLTVGSGAFSDASAQRSVSVNVENDAGAFLELGGTSAFAERNTSEGLLEFEFGEAFGREGQGVGTESKYEFTSVFGLFNRGSDRVKIFGQHEDEEITVQIIKDGEILTEDSPSDWIDPNSSSKFGILLKTKDEVTEVDTTLVISAKTEGAERFA